MRHHDRRQNESNSNTKSSNFELTTVFDGCDCYVAFWSDQLFGS